MIDPNQDGISHINIYSKGATEIGRFLSNFSDCHILVEEGYFRTIEGYWFWLSTKDDRFRKLPGWECKQLSKQLRAPEYPKDPEFHYKICKTIILKMTQSQWCLAELKKTYPLPLHHYYVVNNRVIVPKDGLWMIQLIIDFREDLMSVTY
jgi:hypothetical protein